MRKRSYDSTAFIPVSVITTLFVGEHVCVYYKEPFDSVDVLHRINARTWRWDLTRLAHIDSAWIYIYVESQLRELASDGYRVLELSQLNELCDQNKHLFPVKD